jgi:hypothetical protein
MDPPDAFLEIHERPRKCGSNRAKEILQASKGWPCMLRMFAQSICQTLCILSAETAALEDGAITILQHRSIRSILSTPANVYCFGVAGGMGKKMPCPHCALAQ